MTCINFSGTIIKKLLFKATKRGILETELFLKNFVNEFALKNYNENELMKFIEFLENIDEYELFCLIFKDKKLNTQKYKRFITDLKKFKKLKTSLGN